MADDAAPHADNCRPAGDARMSDVEALMWSIEKDPHLDPTFGSITFLDGPPDVERLRRRLVQATDVVPRLRQRVVPAPGPLGPPEWQDDPDFDIDFHVRHLALPPPGTDRQLYDFASMLLRDPFERSRPLWEFVVVEGLEGGRAALVQKMHHTITDGEGGVRMSAQFLDLERDAPDPGRAPTGTASPTGGPADPVAASWRRTVDAAQSAGAGVVMAVVHPSRLVAFPGDVIETTRSTLRQLAIANRPESPLWTERSLRRRVETLDVPFDEAHRAAKRLGGSLNDLFVSAVAGGAAAYHRRAGSDVDRLRIAMPVSTRTARSGRGNAFVPTRVVVPAGILDPAERFAAIHDALNTVKDHRALGIIEGLAGIANLLPTSVSARFVRDQAGAIDFAASNVRAAPFDLFMAGSRIEATYPLGPLTATAFNITMMSYCGMLNLGLHIDTGAVDDPRLLRECIADGFDELLLAASAASDATAPR